MKYKIAVCKIHMIGAPALILGFCRYDDDDEFWQKFQLFTFEGHPELNREPSEWIPNPPDRKKYHGKTIHFSSIDKTVEVHQEEHDFNLGDAKSVELTKEEWPLLGKELTNDQWQDFDWETWGK